MTRHHILRISTARAALLLAMALTLVLSACSDKDDNSNGNPSTPSTPTTPDEGLAEYAILFYGHGGPMMSLDTELASNIYDLYNGDAASYDKVKVAVQYKWSGETDLKYLYRFIRMGREQPLKLSDAEKAFIDSHYSQTVRFVLDPAQKGEAPKDSAIYFGTKQMLETPFYGQRAFDCSHPDSLLSFINWGIKACPAKRYMLVLSSHGAGYRPDSDKSIRNEDKYSFLDDGTDGTTDHDKGVIADADSQLMISAPELKIALAAADKRMDVVVFDACLMNMNEVVFELRDVTDYVVASTFPVPGIGCKYDALVDEMAKPATTIETVLSNFCKFNSASWTYTQEGMDDPGYFDQSVVRTSTLDIYGQKVRDFTDRLIDAYTNGGDEVRKKIDACTANAIKVESVDPYYELHTYLALIATAVPEYFPEGCLEAVQKAYQACLVERFTCSSLAKYGFLMGVSTLLAHEGVYERYAWRWRSQTEMYLKEFVVVKPDMNIYKQLEWDKATGWSRWLLLNKQKPNGFDYLDPLFTEGCTIDWGDAK